MGEAFKNNVFEYKFKTSSKWVEMNEIRFTSGHWSPMYVRLPIQHHYHLLPHSMCIFINILWGLFKVEVSRKAKEFQDCRRVNF
jgi:hypothetical protein